MTASKQNPTDEAMDAAWWPLVVILAEIAERVEREARFTDRPRDEADPPPALPTDHVAA